MKKNLGKRIAAYLKERVDEFLDREDPASPALVANDIEALALTLRKGDVILVEGRTRISKAIRLFTLSHWTHAVLYIGDELWNRYPERRAELTERYGDHADKLLIEALIKDGVATAPLEKYADHEIRICRPIGIEPERLQRVLDSAIGDVGKQYDNRNIIHLAFQLLPFDFGPFKKKSVQVCIGACSDFEVMCSGVIAKAFQSVGFLIRPGFELPPAGAGSGDRAPRPISVMKHPSHITPKDFDLSCYFAIIKVPPDSNGMLLPAAGLAADDVVSVTRESTAAQVRTTAAV